jgi:hypothetical protein
MGLYKLSKDVLLISFEDISVESVTCFRCIRAPDVIPYPARGKM